MQRTYDQTILNETSTSGSVAVGPRLGIVGGGQLARMTAVAASQLGSDVAVLEKEAFCPAAALSGRTLIGDWNTFEALIELAALSDVVTLENEFVDARLLAGLEERGYLVLPSSRTIALVQDKFIQKQTLATAGLPVPRMRAVKNENELSGAINDFGLPLLLKARRNAYDGKGNVTVRSHAEIESAWKRLGGHEGNLLYVEEFCNFSHELATIITRARDGSTGVYPVAETVQRNHICHIVRAPAPVPTEITERAAAIARRAVEAVGAVGSFGVEMFLTHQQGIMINELAPRVHNSGHYTIDACACSQFENHVRAVLGLPLGSTRLLAPAAVMMNLIGTGCAPGRPAGLDRALAVPGAHVYLYGKTMSDVGRKMGHVTALGTTLAEAEATALRCAREIHFGRTT